MSDTQKPTGPQFKLDFSPVVGWPIFYTNTDEDGEQVEVKIMMRWARPSAADSKKYFELQKRANAAKLDYVNKLQVELAQKMKDADSISAADMPSSDEIEAQTAAIAESIFSLDEQLKLWWKGWKVGAVPGMDADSEADRAVFLNYNGMKAALATALDQLMIGGRQKNSNVPRGL
jgi:hypothetical protein